MQMFSIDYNLLVKNLLPVMLRKSKIEALLRSLISPVKLLYLNYNEYRSKVNKRVEYTGQVIYLEKLLRDRYNEQGISIIDISNLDYNYLLNKSESSKRIVLYNKLEDETKYYIKNSSEFVTQNHFIVKIPSTLYINLGVGGLNKMKGLIDIYRITGKKYLIETI